MYFTLPVDFHSVQKKLTDISICDFEHLVMMCWWWPAGACRSLLRHGHCLHGAEADAQGPQPAQEGDQVCVEHGGQWLGGARSLRAMRAGSGMGCSGTGTLFWHDEWNSDK